MTSFGSVLWEGFREGGSEAIEGGVGEEMNQCEKDIKLHSYEKQKKD